MNSSKNKSSIYFRVDYGGLIGRGHLSRCLALADAFKEKNITPVFIIRKRPTISQEKLPYETIWLKEADNVTTVDSDQWKKGTEIDEAAELLEVVAKNSLIVLDHYALGFSFQKIVRANGHQLILFQDVLNNKFDADKIINYNVGAKDLYKDLSLSSAQGLFGPEYAPLSLNYKKEHILRFDNTTKISSVGIYLGGVEKKYLEQVAKAIASLKYFADKKIEWVISSDEEKKFLETLFKNNQLTIHQRLPGLSDLYKSVQLFIGACGVSYLERACMGIRQFNFLVADNQKDIAASITDNNLGVMLGDIRAMNQNDIVSALEKNLSISPDEAAKQVVNAFSLTDGSGAVLIVEKCLEINWFFRKVELLDSEIIFRWRNNPEVYKYLFNPRPVALVDHEAWMKKIITNPEVLFLVAEYEGKLAGTVRFDFTSDFHEAEIGIYLAPEMHGRKLSASMLAQSELAVKKQFKMLSKINAKVLLENTASAKMFERVGYKELGIEKNYIQLEKKLEN